MRHRSGQRKLNITDGAHRTALLRNIGNALLRYERISTTLIRAKELRRFVEPLITLGKKPSVANRRLAFARLRDRENVVKLFDDLGVRFTSRPGGYLRILKSGYRAGDNAPMALVELVERREVADNPAAAQVTAAKKTGGSDSLGKQDLKPDSPATPAATATTAAVQSEDITEKS